VRTNRFLLLTIFALLAVLCACAHSQSEGGEGIRTAAPIERSCEHLSREYDGGSCGVSFCSDSTGCSFEGDETRFGTFRATGDGGQMRRSVVLFNVSQSVACDANFFLCGEQRTCRCSQAR